MSFFSDFLKKRLGIPEIDFMKIDLVKALVVRLQMNEMRPVVRKLPDGDLIDLYQIVEEEMKKRASADDGN